MADRFTYIISEEDEEAGRLLLHVRLGDLRRLNAEQRADLLRHFISSQVLQVNGMEHCNKHCPVRSRETQGRGPKFYQVT